MIMLAIRGAALVAPRAIRGAPGAFRFIIQRGPRALRARQILRPLTGAVVAGTGAAGVAFGVSQGIDAVQARRRREEPMSMAPRGQPTRLPVRRGQIVTPGPVPVEFVKSWQACAALFAIDTQGVRWVWRPKLGIWKRIRNTRNIVISGKDIRRARRLVRISKRLNKMRTQIR